MLHECVTGGWMHGVTTLMVAHLFHGAPEGPRPVPLDALQKETCSVSSLFNGAVTVEEVV
jgi:hypothetical protein